MNIHELKANYPSRFDSEYREWSEAQCQYHDWWYPVEECFKEDMKPLGVYVNRIYFRLSYCQGDYASFTGDIDFGKWLEVAGYSEQYPVLALAASDYGQLRILDRYDSPRVSLDYCAGNTFPSGVFSDLPYDDWASLEYEQFDAEDWEKLINDWLSDKAKGLYRSIEAEYEYSTSEEAFVEHCEANEVTFDTEEES